MLKRFTALTCGLTSVLVAACAVPAVEGGNNGNDRSDGGEQGETLLTGAMTVAPDGKWALMQRNQTSVLLDVEHMSARELPKQVARFVFVDGEARGIAVMPDRTIVEYDLRTLSEVWRSAPTFVAATGPNFARLSGDHETLLLADGADIVALDATTGAPRGTIALRSPALELSFVPGTTRALVVGETRWDAHQPLTEVADIDFESLTARSIDVPNCSSEIVVLPDASRALLSPTFCEEGVASNGQQTWTNPDPVSIIDLAETGPHFVRNLPGFGPIALDRTGTRAVAYLDVARVDPTLFDDPAQVPSASGPRYHVMSIDPETLKFELFPVGEVLPRFALTRDGAHLLVDATVQRYRGEAKIKATLDSSGHVSASFSVFGKKDSLFGELDLSTGDYTAFSGSAASLDRFVQTGDAKSVYTLKLSADGLGGDLYRIDLEARAATSLGKSLRDIGLLDDGRTLLLRERLPAVQVKTSVTTSWYRRERYCLSLDGITCGVSVDFQDSTPFQSGATCSDYHDC